MIECPRCSRMVNKLTETTGNCLPCRNEEIAMATEDSQDCESKEERQDAAKWLFEMNLAIVAADEPPIWDNTQSDGEDEIPLDS